MYSLGPLLIFLFFFMKSCSARPCSAHEYIYPVAYSDETLFVIRQQSLDSLEVWALSSKNIQQRTKLLSRFFTPAGLKLLPDHKGFSFLHNDAIYIKYFDKRSPKRIELYEPLYGISAIEWLDEKTFYFFAKEHQRWKIYQVTLDGTIKKIVSNETIDALYPQKVGNDLFYIERDDTRYRLMRTLYYVPDTQHVVQEFDNKAIAFLHMISQKEGFFLEYPLHINQDQAIILFWYHHLTCGDNGLWQSHPLFSYAIPTRMLMGNDNDRLFESIAPCIPHYHDGCLYYADCSKTGDILNIFCHELCSGKTSSITTSHTQSCFAPFCVDSRLFYGEVFSH